MKYHGNDIFRQMIIFAAALAIFCSGCAGGGSGENSPVASGPVNSSVIASSISVEKGQDITVNYRTASPVAKSTVFVSDFAFSGRPLWSASYAAASDNGMDHRVVIPAGSGAKYFMIYNSPADQYNNDHRGVAIE